MLAPTFFSVGFVTPYHVDISSMHGQSPFASRIVLAETPPHPSIRKCLNNQFCIHLSPFPPDQSTSVNFKFDIKPTEVTIFRHYLLVSTLWQTSKYCLAD
jgi:hypothetical protein